MEQDITQKEALEILDKMDVTFCEQNLIYYARKSDYNKVELLLKAGINPNKSWRNDKQKKNVYALHNTAGFGEPKMVKLLVDNGADLNLLDEKGESALIYAIQNSKTENVKILIEIGANVNHRTKDNINPLYVATKKKSHEIIELLKKADAQEMTVKEIKSYERMQGAIKIITAIILIGIVLFIVYAGNNGSSSSSSSGSSNSTSIGNHTCLKCGNSYSGNGWMTVGGEQYQPTSDNNGDQYCSSSCAYEAQSLQWKNVQ